MELLVSAGCIFLIVGLFYSFVSSAKEIESIELQSLKLVPNKCVALRKGRECFATIKVKWHASQSDKYCLRRLSDKQQLNCWSASTAGKFSYVFSSSTDEQLELVRAKDDRVLAVSKIRVSWVYNSNKRRKRWRVF